MHTFLASETGGGGNAQKALGNAPSSKAQSSTVRHLLQLFRSDFLPIPLDLCSCLNPPKRGAPGVPGVTGVEGAEGTSSLLLLSITQTKTAKTR